MTSSGKGRCSDLAFLTVVSGLLNYLNSRLQGKCQLVSQLYNNVSAFRMKLSLINSHRLNSNTCDFPNYQKIFQQYKTNSCWYVTHNEQLQQTFTSRSVDLDQDIPLFRTLLTILMHHIQTLNLFYSSTQSKEIAV
jgi:hypothetical protein